MRDIANNEIHWGDKVKILFSDYESQVGKIVKVILSDNPDKIKVEFNESWVGYFFPYEIVKYNEKEEKQKEQLENHELIFEILRNSNHPEYQNVIKAIRKKYKSPDEIFNYLFCKIDICDDFSAKQWFEFGQIFYKPI